MIKKIKSIIIKFNQNFLSTVKLLINQTKNQVEIPNKKAVKLKKFDLFSSQFKLNFRDDQYNKRSCFGGFHSIAVIIISLLYCAYLTFEYISNQIEPKYKTQTFLTEDQISIEFDKDFIGFSYYINNNTTVQMLEQQKNKKYFVYISYLLVQDSFDSQIIKSPNFKCTNKKLLGYQCFGVSNLKHKYLLLNTKENSKTNLILIMHRCNDTDTYKTFIPENRASEEEIDQIINDDSGMMHIKMLTSKYNIASKEVQTNQKNVLIFLQGDNFVSQDLKHRNKLRLFNKVLLFNTKTHLLLQSITFKNKEHLTEKHQLRRLDKNQ
ncbi:hypothetical protein ABPG72_006690 [Tetrahymena utriculariae]